MPARELAIDPEAKPTATRLPRVLSGVWGNLVVVGGLVVAVVLLAIPRDRADEDSPRGPDVAGSVRADAPLPFIVSERGLTVPGAIVEPDDERDGSGAIVASWPRTVLAPATGVLAAWHVSAGDRVRNDRTPIATIDSPALVRERAALAATLESVRAEIARRRGVARDDPELADPRDAEIAALVNEYKAAQTLHDSISGSELTALRALLTWARATLALEQAALATRANDDRRDAVVLEGELRRLEARAEAVESALAGRVVVAPVNARVLARRATVGQWLRGARGWTLGSPEPSALVSLYDPAHLRVRVVVPASRFSVQPGRPDSIRVASAAIVLLPTRSTSYVGTVVRVLPETASTGRGVVVWVSFAQPDDRCVPGLAGEVTFPLADAPEADELAPRADVNAAAQDR